MGLRTAISSSAAPLRLRTARYVCAAPAAAAARGVKARIGTAATVTSRRTRVSVPAPPAAAQAASRPISTVPQMTGPATDRASSPSQPRPSAVLLRDGGYPASSFDPARTARGWRFRMARQQHRPRLAQAETVHHLPQMSSRAALALALVAMGLVAGCMKRGFGQTKSLGSQAKVTLEDAWILNHTPPLLEVILAFEGGDPHRNYDFKAALRPEEHGPELGGGWIHQIQIPQGQTPNQHRVMWEFGYFPRESPNIYFRLEFTDRLTGQTSSVDFKLPGAHGLRIRKMGSQ